MFIPERGDTWGTSVLENSNRHQERRMSRFAMRLLTLAMYATALAAVPMVTPVKAATASGKEIKKHKKRIHNSASIAAPKSSSPFPPMYDDPDRKAAGGGY
jgi:hypothetical protein